MSSRKQTVVVYPGNCQEIDTNLGANEMIRRLKVKNKIQCRFIFFGFHELFSIATCRIVTGYRPKSGRSFEI